MTKRTHGAQFKPTRPCLGPIAALPACRRGTVGRHFAGRTASLYGWRRRRRPPPRALRAHLEQQQRRAALASDGSMVIVVCHVSRCDPQQLRDCCQRTHIRTLRCWPLLEERPLELLRQTHTRATFFTHPCARTHTHTPPHHSPSLVAFGQASIHSVLISRCRFRELPPLHPAGAALLPLLRRGATRCRLGRRSLRPQLA